MMMLSATVTQARTNHSDIFAAAFWIVLILGGCSDPRFKQSQEVRDARITRHLNDYAAYDAAGFDRMRQTIELADRLEKVHAEKLTRTCGLVRAIHEHDVRRWKEEEPLRKERLQALLRGKPEQIDDTYARMAY